MEGLEIRTDVYIPVLDDPITGLEVSDQIKRLKSDKCCGSDGIPPVVFKVLPFAWVMYIFTLFRPCSHEMTSVA